MIKIKELVITYPQAKTVCKAFIPMEQRDIQEKAGVSLRVVEDGGEKGKIFAILNSSETPENQRLADFLEEKIKKYYEYSLPTQDKKSEIENIFEDFLYDLNNKFQIFQKKEKISVDLSEINLLIGLLYFNEKESTHYLYFSQIGELESLLVYKNKNGESNIAQIKESREAGNKINNSKIFSNLISGKIKNGSSLIFSSSNVLDYIPLDKLRLIAADKEAPEISKEIKKLLMEAPDENTFCAISANVKISESKKRPSPLFAFSKKEEIKTEPAEDESVKEEIKLSGALEEAKRKTTVFEQAGEKKFAPPKKYPLLYPFHLLKIIVIKIYFILFYIFSGRLFKNLYRKIINFPKNYKQLPLLRKSLLIASIILITLFIQSIGYLKHQKIQEENLKKYQSLLMEIDAKKTELEASLIYNSQDKAAAILVSLEDLIKQLPQDSDEQKVKLKEIKEQIKKLTFKAKLITEIENPTELADYSKLISTQINSIALNDGYIYSATGQNNFFRLNLNDLSADKIELGTINLPAPKTIEAGEKNILALHENGTFSKLDIINTKIKPIEVKFPGTNINIACAATYGGRLYTVDVSNDLIYKHQASGDDYSVGSPWLSNEANLNKVVGMTIDGSVYLLKSDGTIMEFFMGKEQPFNFTNANSLLTEGSKIWTNANSDFLYILDSLGKKIAVINKKGEMVIQYYSEQFDNLNDFAINEKTKKIYALAQNKIFEINATHLK